MPKPKSKERERRTDRWGGQRPKVKDEIIARGGSMGAPKSLYLCCEPMNPVDGEPLEPRPIEVGETVTFKATVKDHEEYKGEFQTKIQRLKEC